MTVTLSRSGETVQIGPDRRDVPAAYVTADGYRVVRRIAQSMPGTMVFGQRTTGDPRTDGWIVLRPEGRGAGGYNPTLARARETIAHDRKAAR
jgi:hypothetical protein